MVFGRRPLLSKLKSSIMGEFIFHGTMFWLVIKVIRSSFPFKCGCILYGNLTKFKKSGKYSQENIYKYSVLAVKVLTHYMHIKIQNRLMGV